MLKLNFGDFVFIKKKFDNEEILIKVLYAPDDIELFWGATAFNTESKYFHKSDIVRLANEIEVLLYA